MNVNEHCLFNEGHMWCRLLDDATYLVGISDHAQESLGEIAYIELPACGTSIEKGAALGVIESVKVVNELIAPVSGVVVEVNDSLTADPTVVNQTPYGDGWLLRIHIHSTEQLNGLMSHAEYLDYTG